MSQSRVMQLARWPAPSRSSGGGAVGGNRRARVDGGGSAGRGRGAGHRKPGRNDWLQPIVQGDAGPEPHAFAQRGADRPRIAVAAVGRDPVRRVTPVIRILGAGPGVRVLGLVRGRLVALSRGGGAWRGLLLL